jgi:membrane-associated phospholipid phosphatase
MMTRFAFVVAMTAVTRISFAGGPLRIDHRWDQEAHGIWNRTNQNILQYGALVLDAGFALWEGGESRLGKTAWQSIDSVVAAGAVTGVMKPVFGRVRPAETDNPNQWFKRGHYSFPSGEVAEVSAIVTPYILEYAHDHPAVYALEIIPAYDMLARMTSQGHWQTDVLAGFAIGTAAGYLAHKRDSPFLLGILPGGVGIGFKKQF